jgi:hypothetical protein
MSDLDLAALATKDEALTEAVTSLMWRMVDEANDILDRGSPRDRVRLLSANLPALTRSLKTDEASQMADVRNAITALMIDVRGSLLPDRDVPAE